MKRHMFLLLAAAMLLCIFAGCAPASPQPEPTPLKLPTGATERVGAASQPTPQSPAAQLTMSELPIIDGSSSTELMHSAIRGHFDDAWLPVTHSRTYDALERLVPNAKNPADVLLAVKYYDETLADVTARGADLVITPIAKEGFIFLLHADNPINSLTQQQIRDIYSGIITNWKQLGGLDEEIVPFRRNESSGSQTAMFDFMRGFPFPDAPADEYDVYIAYSMSGMLDDLEWEGSAAIGYNIFSWSMEQELEWMNLKPVAVDGILPTNETIGDDTYPLNIFTYSYYNAGNEKGRALTEWLLTDEGQDAIASAGYVGLDGRRAPEGVYTWMLHRDQDASGSAVYRHYYDKYQDYLYPQRTLYGEDAAPYANGLGKHVTTAWILGEPRWLSKLRYVMPPDEFYFITVTRERGDEEFDVINEGAVTDKALITDIYKNFDKNYW